MLTRLVAVLSFLCVSAHAYDGCPTLYTLLTTNGHPQLISVSSFQRVDGLGSDVPVTLIVKNTTAVAFKPDRVGTTRQAWENGVVAIGPLTNVINKPTAGWHVSAGSPHGFAAQGERYVICAAEGLVVTDPTGKTVRTIHAPQFRNLHSVEFCPTDPNRVLVASSGMETLYEVDLRDGKILWQWDAREHGFDQTLSGIHIVSEGAKLPPHAKKLTVDEAVAMAQDKRTAPPDQYWYLPAKDVPLNDKLGVPKWARTAFPNWAGYRDGDRVLVSLFTPGAAVEIDRRTGKSSTLQNGLAHPHGVIAIGSQTQNGFVISDTEHGTVRLLNSDGKLRATYDFKGFPLSATPGVTDREWIQHTYPIGKGLFATVDSRRNKIFIWDPENHVYSEYPYHPQWLVQSVQSAP